MTTKIFRYKTIFRSKQISSSSRSPFWSPILSRSYTFIGLSNNPLTTISYKITAIKVNNTPWTKCQILTFEFFRFCRFHVATLRRFRRISWHSETIPRAISTDLLFSHFLDITAEVLQVRCYTSLLIFGFIIFSRYHY